MARLYRPHIPLAVRCDVAERQLRQREEAARVRYPRPRQRASAAVKLAFLLDQLSQSMMCEIKDLRLDHDPALALRPRIGKGKETVYSPEANDPRYLEYCPHGAEFDGSHDVKTRIRGDHGQYSDIVLIKRQRRREKKAHKPAHKTKPKWAKRGKLSTTTRSRFPKAKSSWPTRKFPKRRK